MERALRATSDKIGLQFCEHINRIRVNKSVELGVKGLVDDPHPAFAELLQNLIVRYRLADEGRHKSSSSLGVDRWLHQVRVSSGWTLQECSQDLVQSGSSMAEPKSTLVSGGKIPRSSAIVKFTHFPGSSYHLQTEEARSFP